jgi:hypothetical protein
MVHHIKITCHFFIQVNESKDMLVFQTSKSLDFLVDTLETS